MGEGVCLFLFFLFCFSLSLSLSFFFPFLSEGGGVREVSLTEYEQGKEAKQRLASEAPLPLLWVELGLGRGSHSCEILQKVALSSVRTRSF